MSTNISKINFFHELRNRMNCVIVPFVYSYDKHIEYSFVLLGYFLKNGGVRAIFLNVKTSEYFLGSFYGQLPSSLPKLTRDDLDLVSVNLLASMRDAYNSNKMFLVEKGVAKEMNEHDSNWIKNYFSRR